MHTTDFTDGSFYEKDGVISYLSNIEAQYFSNLLTDFKPVSADIDSLVFDTDCSIPDFCVMIRHISNVGLPVKLSDEGRKILEIFGISVAETDSAFIPASQFCKAMHQELGSSFTPIKTEQRLMLVDFSTKSPSSTSDIIINKNSVLNYKTVFPDSLYKWCSILQKAKSFKTADKNLQNLKSLFLL